MQAAKYRELLLVQRELPPGDAPLAYLVAHEVPLTVRKLCRRYGVTCVTVKPSNCR